MKRWLLRLFPVVSAMLLVLTAACDKSLEDEPKPNVVAATSVKVSPSSTTLNVGESTTLTATITPSNAVNKSLVWTSSNASVAMVADGKVTALAEGTAYITAKTSNNLTSSCTVTVKGAGSGQTPGGGTQSGLYLGIMGFNDDLYPFPITQLTDATKPKFDSFIDGLATGKATILYHSVDKAIDAMKSAQLPSDLTSVSIVTFTDGLDQGSISFRKDFSDDQFLSYLSNRIQDQTIGGNNITAYSIGLEGPDAEINSAEFEKNLIGLASSGKNFSSENMSQINAQFNKIAGEISKSHNEYSVLVRFPVKQNGTVFRFTFDKASSAQSSSVYIEGTLNLKEERLENIVYHGLTSTSGSIVKAKLSGVYLDLKFEKVLPTNNAFVLSTENMDEWYKVPGAGWNINSEVSKDKDLKVITEKTSALVMLVLDCSSSLGSKFIELQSIAKEFINNLNRAQKGENISGSGSGSGSPTSEVVTYKVNGVSFDMILVDGGTYQMGSNNGDDDEKPVHSEMVGTFYMGKTEVTQALWKAVMGSNPSYFKGDNLPVEKVSWNDCQTFIQRLNNLTGQKFRLPSEAEWEYAARGGNKSRGYTYSGSSTLSSVGWYDGNSGNTTHPVATKQANELGIYDMSGNVWEWTSDNWCSNYSAPRSSSHRVIRGGSWLDSAPCCRVANRGGLSPDYADGLGLRLAL